MKSLIYIYSIAFVSISVIYSTPVTNINAVYRNGQVFVTWDNSNGQFYIMYKSAVPIVTGSQLQSAQNLGKVWGSSSLNQSLGRYLRIDSASPPLSAAQGLFAATTSSNGSYYYAVTSVISGIEDTAIIPGSNSLNLPVNETVDDPKPVWQLDSLIAPKMFHIYVWFATRVTSANFPKMTNLGTFPMNFAVVQQGNQSPHPVTFWLRSSIDPFVYQGAWGTGDPNEWIISIDDFNPSTIDYHTVYYGYHENYDLYHQGFNPIPDTGTIYNYTSAMVEHTVNWALRNLPLDSTRTYMTGWSLGAVGSIFNSLMMPSKIAAVFIYAPLFNVAQNNAAFLNRMYGTYATNLFTNEGMRRNERLNANYLLSLNRLNSLPIIYSFCGKNDMNVGWSEKIAFYDTINSVRAGGYHFWSMGTHEQVIQSNPWQLAAYPPNFSYFTRYRTNLSYPAFSNCSVNNDPGIGSPVSGDSIGTINGFLEWNDDIVDSTYRWEITLKTKELVTIYDTLSAPDSCTADVTLRRLQMFNVGPGNTIHWTNTKNNQVIQDSSFIYSGGLITIRNVKIYSSTNTLSLTNIPIGIVKNNNSIPLNYKLFQNYPNPFNPKTQINFDLPKESLVKLVVYDVLGREVYMVLNNRLKAGKYYVIWDASNYPSGVYFYKLAAGDYAETKKMILVK